MENGFSFQKIGARDKVIENKSSKREMREFSYNFHFSLEFHKSIVIGWNIEYKGVAYN